MYFARVLIQASLVIEQKRIRRTGWGMRTEMLVEAWTAITWDGRIGQRSDSVPGMLVGAT
jgi:hypothetical protein